VPPRFASIDRSPCRSIRSLPNRIIFGGALKLVDLEPPSRSTHWWLECADGAINHEF
jgi:hypothetical protein